LYVSSSTRFQCKGGVEMAEVEKHQTYLEEILDADITYETDKIKFVFQRAKVKMVDEREIHLLRTIDRQLHKAFELTEDQVIITYHLPKSYAHFHTIYEQSKRARWQFAYNVLQTIRNHSLERAKLIVSPENIVYDQGLVPCFLHYGISESIPPYEDDEERLWLETKAMIAVIADNQYDFVTYLSHYETKELPKTPQSIMHAESYEEIIEIIDKNIKENDAYEQTVVPIPENKWKFRRYVIWALTILLLPSIAYSSYALFFKVPETDAYVESNRYFLEEEYSSVVDTLSKYNHDKMPKVVQYELATSYVVNESLTEEQRQNIQNTISLQSDRKYLLYWIDIGRGNYQDAIDHARLLEDRDLIVYGLLKLREDVKADQGLSGSEREEELNKIEQEIDEYENEMEEEQREAEEAEEEEGKNETESEQDVEEKQDSKEDDDEKE